MLRWHRRLPARSLRAAAVVLALAAVTTGVLAAMRWIDELTSHDAGSPIGLDGACQSPPSGSVRPSRDGVLSEHPDRTSPLHDVDTWAPLLGVVRHACPDLDEWAGGISSVGSFSLPRTMDNPNQADMRLFDALEPVHAALERAGKTDVAFSVAYGQDDTVEITFAAESATHTVVRSWGSNTAGHVLLTDDAVAEPARREPQTYPGASAAPSTDPARLRKVLHERMPDAVGATPRQLDDLEARLGAPVPPELRAVLSVNGAGSGGARTTIADADVSESRHQRDLDALAGIELFAVDQIERAPDLVGLVDGMPFDMLARAAPTAGPDSAVQGLVESREWIVIGDLGGGTGDLVAIDMAPGPGGHVGQVVVLNHESDGGAVLLAPSITDLVLNGPRELPADDGQYRANDAAAVVNSAEGMTVDAAATDELEVLVVGSWDDAPSDLRPLVGLPHVRTLIADPGKIADPLVIGGLDHLEYLEIGIADWRALLDADAVPRSLLAAGISGPVDDPAAVDAVYDRLIRLWGGDPLRTVTLRGSLSSSADRSATN